MRIALDYQIFAHQAYGGISRYCTQLAKGLLNLQQDAAVFAPLHRNRYVQALPPGVVHGAGLRGFPPKTTPFFLAYNEWISRPKIARWQPDVLHETYYSRRRTAPAKCPTVVTVHDMIHELFSEEVPITDNTAALKKIAVDRADHVICVSENTKNDLINLYRVAPEKISIVFHGFDSFDNAGMVSAGAPGAVHKPFLLFVGSRSRYKNFSGLLKSVAASSRLLADFDIVAFGGPRFSGAEFSMIRSLGFKENQVRQTSGSDALLGRYYQVARAFVYPSLYEGFGIPPLEAMAQDCPVICSSTSSIPEVVGSAAEYFDPLDTNLMRMAIESVVYSDSRVQELRAFGHERLNSFSWPKCARETLAVYESLL